MNANLRSLTPPTTRVVGSSRFRFPSDFFSRLGLFIELLSEWTIFDFLPILEASKRSNPAAAMKIRTVQYLTSFLTTRRANSFLNRYPGFLRFLLRTRTRIRPSSSESSSDTEIDMLLLLNIDDDFDEETIQMQELQVFGKQFYWARWDVKLIIGKILGFYR